MNKNVYVKLLRKASTTIDGQIVNIVSSSNSGGGKDVDLSNLVKKSGDTMTGQLTTVGIVTNEVYAIDESGDKGVLNVEANTNLNGNTTANGNITINGSTAVNGYTTINDSLDIDPGAKESTVLKYRSGKIWNWTNSNSFLVDWSAKIFKTVRGIFSSDYAPGLAGAGFSIEKDIYGKWRGEMDSISVREFMEVPELRFNRIDIVSGEQWNCPGFGLIESVDAVSQIIKVKLLEGEKLSIHFDDICRGIFHNIDSANNNLDSNGFEQIEGFATSYFKPTELLSDNCSFKYELQPGTTIHPSKAMKFISYGNFSDVERQKSYYSTRSYSRYLVNVNDWVINPDRNIIYQQGDLEGLTIKGVTMRGTGTFLSNIYMTGTTIQWTPEQLEDIKGKDAYSVSLSSYEGFVKLNNSGKAIIVGEENVVNGENNIVSGVNNIITTSFKLSTHIQVFKGTDELIFSESQKKGTYTVRINPIGCEAVIARGVLYITSISNINSAYVNINVVCEGVSSFNKQYSIIAYKDGNDGANGTNGSNGTDGTDGVDGTNGTNGTNGTDGADGINVATGSMPRNCGEYNPTAVYIYSKNFRDIVYVSEGALEVYYQVAEFGTQVSSVPERGNNEWMLGDKRTFTAFDTLIAEGANLGNLIMKNEKLVSETKDSAGNHMLLIDGKKGYAEFRDVKVFGEVNATSGVFSNINVQNGSNLGNWSIERNILVNKILTGQKDVYSISELGNGNMIIQEPFGYGADYSKNRVSGIFVNTTDNSKYPNIGFSEYSTMKVSAHHSPFEKANALEVHSQYGLALNIIKGGIKIKNQRAVTTNEFWVVRSGSGTVRLRFVDGLLVDFEGYG